MDSKNSNALNQFIEIVIDTRDSGLRIFNEWVKKDPVLIKKSDPEFYQTLKSLSEREVQIINSIVPMILNTSFYSLFDALESGKDNCEFELKMKTTDSNETFTLIDDESDNQIRVEIDSR